MSNRWTTTTHTKRSTVAERRAVAREQALQQCQQGMHTSTPTFRPGETVCMTCGLVVSCPVYLDVNHLSYPWVYAHLSCTSASRGTGVMSSPMRKRGNTQHVLTRCPTKKEGETILIEESTAHNVASYEPQHENLEQRSISFQFSLQILTREGFSVWGDATMQKTSVPQRASRPVQQATDIDEGLDDVRTPSSARRYKQTTAHLHAPNTGPIEAPIVTHRVSGTTRAGLYLLLFFCVVFLLNGIVWPMIVNIGHQLQYGSDNIASFDIDNHHFITQETHGKVRIIVTSADGQHTQDLTTVISGTGDHALVTLTQDDANIDVTVNGAYVTSLVPDGHGMYKWKDA